MENVIETVGHEVDRAPSVVAAARANLERIVERGIENAGPVIERVLNQVPEDRVAEARQLRFATSPTGHASLRFPSGAELRLHDNALGQAASSLGVPVKFARDLAHSRDAWKHELFARVLNDHAEHAGSRHLVRALSGEARAFLSDRYGRYDCRPLLDAFVQACQRIGAVPVEGVASDLRAQVRAIIPRVYEPVAGQPLVYGLAWHNSDFGAGAYGVSAFAIRLVCLNGMIGESNLRRVHLAGKLPDDLRLSEETVRSNTKYLSNLTHDIVGSVLSPEAIERRSAQIQAANEQKVDWHKAYRQVSKVLTKGEADSVKAAFESKEEVMLPPGQTLWRFSNALSWVANQAEDPERKIELQRAAGAVVIKETAN